MFETSSDSEDGGRRARPGEPDDENPGNQVGGGTPWIPPFPPAEMKLQHPSIVTWHENEEDNIAPFDTFGSTWRQGTYPESDTTRKCVPITMYRYEDSTGVKTVVGNLFGSEWLTYRRIKWFMPNPIPGTLDRIGGCRLRLPYYWDGVSPRTPAMLKIQSIKNHFDDTNGGYVWKIYALDDKSATLGTSPVTGTVTRLPTENVNNRHVFPVTDAPLDGTQYNSFNPGWNWVYFKIGLCKGDETNGQNNNLLPFTNGNNTITNHYTFLIHEVFTSLPVGVNFEFIRQPNFTPRLGIKVLQNGTLLEGDLDADGGGEATRTIVNPTNFAAGAPIDLRTRVRWTVWSSNNDGSLPNENRLDDYWWEAKMSTVFPMNHESRFPVLVAPESGIGPVGDPLPDTNYFKYEDGRVNTAFPGGSRQWKAKNVEAVAMSAPPSSHMDMALSGTAYWYMPYNIKALTYLKQGTPVHDTFEIN